MTVATMRAQIDFNAARRAMIESQLRPSGVNDAYVLAAMSRVPREDFVPDPVRASCYGDRAVPLGEGRFLAAPIFYGRLLSEARPSSGDKALIIDGGSGYLRALVEPLVDMIEVVDPASAVERKGRKGDAFSLLLIDGAVERLPAPLAARLDEGARIVTGLVQNGVTRLAFGRKVSGEVSLISLVEMGVPILREFAEPKGWSF